MRVTGTREGHRENENGEIENRAETKRETRRRARRMTDDDARLCRVKPFTNEKNASSVRSHDKKASQNVSKREAKTLRKR